MARDVRTVVVTLFARMLNDNGSLSNLLPIAEREVSDADRSLLKAMSFGLARHSLEMQALVDPLLQKPLKQKDMDVYLLMQLGVLQIVHMNVPTHAAVDATVSATKTLRKPWAKGLVNAVLRNFIRQRDALEKALTPMQRASFPEWLYKEIENDWAELTTEIVAHSNIQAPMVLRVNRLQTTAEEYAQQLQDAGIDCATHALASDALVLENPVSVEQLPNFSIGMASVQDAAAQLAVSLLADSMSVKTSADESASLRLLDACAAPGGKTGHMLESIAHSRVTAVDVSKTRLERVTQNLERLGLQTRASLVAAEAQDTNQWWDGEPFDAVLLDAPCSATGVIRRHPDIKLLRRAEDIDALVGLQTDLLDALWLTLKPGGLLMYATCSILKRENVLVVADFLGRHGDASEERLSIEGAHTQAHGIQLLPGTMNTDGFFYALIKKSA